jgi:hypothetical protein
MHMQLSTAQMRPGTIDEVIRRLDDVIEDCRKRKSRAGYFTSLYRHVTIAVKEGIDFGRFEDGERMERFDVIFASRYLDSYYRFLSGDGISKCWLTAFESCGKRRLLILQQLMLAMNAHINLDLGIAAAHTSPGDELIALKGDFDQINKVLFELVDGVQSQIAKVSPWIGLLDRLGGRADEMIAEVLMGSARNKAWKFAEELAPLNPDDQTRKIGRYDAAIDLIARKIRYPGLLFTLKTLPVRIMESDDVPQVIDSLNDYAESARKTLFTS